jgi:hypothetical protein
MSAGSPVELAPRPITDKPAESLSFASVTALSTSPAVGKPVAFVRVTDAGVPRAALISSLSVFKFVKLESNSEFSNGLPLPALVTIVDIASPQD